MFILNKNKHFNKVTEDLFNMAMANIRELNVILTPCGAKRFIEKDKDAFVSITFLYVLFFQECALQKRYYPRYKEEASIVLDAMLLQIAERFHYNIQKYTDLYLDIRKILNDLSDDPVVARVGLYYSAAVLYLQYVFSGKYSIEDDANIYGDDTPCVKVGEFFQHIIGETTAYLA